MRRAGLAAALYAGVTVALLWPLFRMFGSAYAHDAGDSVLNTWILWWGTRAVPLTQAWWNGPMFFPARDTMALSELLLAQLPISGLVQVVSHNPVAAFNTVYVLSFAASGMAGYLLAREVTGREDAALVGGLAYLLAPYRATQLSHVQVLSYYWAPVVLLALHRHLRENRGRWLGLFGAAWLLQVLANGYALFELSILVGLWILWFARPFSRAVAIVAAWVVASLPLLPILLKYRAIHGQLHLLRDINEIKGFGIDLADVLAAPPDLLVWGGRLLPVRPETAVFPGITLIALGLVAAVRVWHQRTVPDDRPRAWRRACVAGAVVAAAAALSVVVFRPWRIGPLSVTEFRKPLSIAALLMLAAFVGGPWVRRRWQERSIAGFYVLAMAAMYLLALGPEPRLLGHAVLYEPPYAWFMRLPGFDVMRVPARFVMLASLCQAVLVASAIAALAHGRGRTVLAGILAIGIVCDGWIRLPVAPAPSGGILAWEHVAAVVELPLGDINADFAALFRSMRHGVPTVNGVSGYFPPHVLPLAQALRARQFSALFELSDTAPIGVELDRTRADAVDVERIFKAMGLAPGPRSDAWEGFIVLPRTRPVAHLGAPLGVRAVHASKHPENAGRMLDDNLYTAWGTEAPQVGDEEVEADLGAVRDVGAIVLQMGAYSFGYPYQLEIDLSEDRTDWHPVWGGEIGVLAVRAAVREPGVVPIALDIAHGRGRYVRLRQTGVQPRLPWWIAELRIHAPAAEGG